MEKCLICNKNFENKKKLSSHIRISHNMTAKEYKIEFGILKKCVTCGILLNKKNKTGYCNSHRDRTGINNPFYNKHHTKETIEILKKVCKEKSLKNWQDEEYREKVVNNTTGKKRSGGLKKLRERML